MRGFFLVSVSIHMGGMPYLVEQIRQLQSCHPQITIHRIDANNRRETVVADPRQQERHGLPERHRLNPYRLPTLLAWLVSVQISRAINGPTLSHDEPP